MNIIGHTIGGHYQVLDFLARGGFGETYVAKDTHLPGNPLRVVKILKPQFSDPDELATAKRLFDNEAKTLYKLGDHEQIPQLFAHFEEGQDFYLVQEYIQGSDLSTEICIGKQFSEFEVIQLLQEILNILKFIHKENVIHRDIKPSNLMRRTSDNKIVLIDFGTVKQVCSQGKGMTTIPIGTCGYTPHEQFVGRPKFCSDIYALGITAIQSLTGLDPMTLQDPNSLEISWRDKASVSPHLGTILDKMVRQDFKNRYQSADEVLQALFSSATTAIPIKTTSNHNTSAKIKINKFRFNVLVVFIIVGILGTVVGVSCVSFIFPSGNNREPPKQNITW